jgi:hypothetical protein
MSHDNGQMAFFLQSHIDMIKSQSEWVKFLYPLMNDPVKCIYTPDTHNEAVAILKTHQVDGNLDEKVCSICGGLDDYSKYIMDKAIAIRNGQ